MLYRKARRSVSGAWHSWEISRQRNPAGIDLAQAGLDCREIDPAKRETSSASDTQFGPTK
jgi:hypothetical protein